MKTIIMMNALLLSLCIEARDSTYAADRFGYTQAASCTADYLDLSVDGTAVTLTPSGAAAADDDGGAVVNLIEPFLFYRTAYQSIVVSSNGYMALADDLSQESGGDFSNDCLFPSVPDNQPGVLARIMPFHDELQNSGSGGIRTAYYPLCPRVGSVTSSCTVIDWFDWQIRGTAGGFDFQVILYHQNHQIVMQYGSNNPVSDGASIGIQDGLLNSGVILSCNDAGRNLANTAYCLQNPVIFADDFEQ